MKNPYKRKDAYFVRGWLVGTGVVLVGLQLTMLALLLDAMTAPGLIAGWNKMLAACVGLGVLLTVNGIGMYWVTTKWEWLWEAKWKVWVAVVTNILFAGAYGGLAVLGHGLWEGLTGQLILLVMGLAVLTEIGATVAAVMRLKEK